MKFVLFVEGHTEKVAIPSFLQRWLNCRLSRNVGIKAVRFEGWPEMLREMAKKAKMYLDRYSDVIAVLGLMDLYGPTFYPDDRNTTEDRLEWATQYLEKKVDAPQFRMFFAVHDVEAWLLSEPSLFPREICKAFQSGMQSPETIDFNEPPSKLLNRIYYQKTRRRYKKVAYGKALFARLDPEIAHKKCPNLRNLMDEMLRMAKESGL